MNCPKCGRTCQLDDFFCARCGAKLPHDNVTFEPEEKEGKDLRPLSANPVRPDRPAGSPFVERKDKPAHTHRQPLFEGYEPVESAAPAEEVAPLSADQEPTAVYRRREAAPAVVDQDTREFSPARIAKEGSPAFAARKLPPRQQPVIQPEEDEFGWNEEESAAESKTKKKRAPLFSRSARMMEEEEDDFVDPEEAFEEDFDEEFDEAYDEDFEEEEEEPVRPVKPPRRKPLPDLKKPVSHIRPVSQDRPREDPVFLFDDELEEEEERGGNTGLHLKILAFLTLVALVVFGICFFKVTDTGRRIQAMVGFSDESEDYILLGNYHMERGSYSEAAEAYYSAFLLDQEDYELALRVAEGLKQATDYDRAVKLYMYLSDVFPDRTEATDRLLALYQELGWTENYEALLEKTGRNQTETAPAPAVSAPAPQQQQPTTQPETQIQGSFSGPTVSVPGGAYPYTVQLTMTTVSGAEIYYTLDGSQPSTQSTLYTGIILLSESQTYHLRAIAVLDGSYSYELNETYEIQIN